MLRVEMDGLTQTRALLDRAQAGTPGALADAARDATAEWVPALTARASTAAQRKLIVSGATVQVGTNGFDLIAARGPSLSGGLDSSHWYAVDYGMTPRRVTSARRRSSIWVGRNLPPRAGKGRVIFPTLTEKAHVFVEAWARAVVGELDGGPLDVNDRDVVGQVSGSWR